MNWIKEFFIKSNKEKKSKQKTLVIGRRRVFSIVLWSVFIFAFGWSVYKNFTAIDIHTIETKEVVETKVIDTAGMQSFVSDFIDCYFTYDSDDSDMMNERKEDLSDFLSNNLVSSVSSLIPVDSGISSYVDHFSFLNIEKVKDYYYDLSFSVVQSISRIEITTEKQNVKENVAGKIETKEVEKPVSKEVNSTVTSYYSVTLYVDDNNKMVIIQLPTITSKPERSEYELPELLSDTSIDVDVKDEITDFLTTFFELYPKADELTLSYYVKDNCLPVVNANCEFVQLRTPVYCIVDNKYMAYVTVDYLNNDTGAHQYSQYYLQLEKQDKWVIVSNNFVGLADFK